MTKTALPDAVDDDAKLFTTLFDMQPANELAVAAIQRDGEAQDGGQQAYCVAILCRQLLQFTALQLRSRPAVIERDEPQ